MGPLNQVSSSGYSNQHSEISSLRKSEVEVSIECIHQLRNNIFKTIKELNRTSLEENPKKYDIIWEKSLCLLEIGFMNDVQEIAEEMPNIEEKWDILAAIARKLAARGYFGKCFITACKVTAADFRIIIFHEIISDIYLSGQIKNAIERISRLPSNVFRDQFFQCASKVFIKNGHLMAAKELMDKMANAMPKWLALHDLCVSYAKNDDIDGVIQAGVQITDKSCQERSLLPITYTFLEKGAVDNAEKILDVLAEGEGKWSFLVQMCQTYLEKKAMDRLIGRTEKILDQKSRGRVFLAIVKAFLEKGHITEAENILALMPDQATKRAARIQICLAHSIKQAPDEKFERCLS